MKRPSKILLIVAPIVVVVVLLLVLLGGGETVTAEADDAAPSIADLNRADTDGADTVQAYLQASLPCDAAADDVRRALSGGRDPIAEARRTACAASSSTWSDEAKATLTDEPSDSRGRAVWKVSGLDGLPDGFRLVVRMPKDAWVVEDSCNGTCPIPVG